MSGFLCVANKRVRGLADPDSPIYGLGQDGKPIHQSMALVDIQGLISERFDCDAHFVAYRVVSEEGEAYETAARLRKEALAPIREMGGDVVCSLVVIDVDLHDVLGLKSKTPWSALPKDIAEATLKKLTSTEPSVGRFSYFYTTKNGCRYIYLLALDVPAGSGYEALLQRFHDSFWNAGIPVDRSCKDWTRMFRAPLVTLEDGTSTWESPWLHCVDRLEEDDAYYVPTEDDLIPQTVETVQLLRADSDRPDDDEAHALVWSWDGDSRKLTADATRAERVLRNNPIHAYIFGGVKFASGGHRHTKLTKMVGILVSELSDFPWATPPLVYALAREAVLLIDQDEDWAGKAWEMVSSFWGRTKAQVKAKTQGTKEDQSDDLPTGDEQLPTDDPGDSDDPDQNSEANTYLGDIPDEFTFDQHDKPYPTIPNIRLALKLQGVEIFHDEFAGFHQISIHGSPPTQVTDSHLRGLWLQAEERYRLKVAKDKYIDILFASAIGYHPVRDYLGSLIWDQQPRVETWLSTYLGVEDNEFTREVGKLFLVAAARRIYEPGCKFDEILLLEGAQGTRKSTAIGALVPNSEWFSDDLPLGATGKEVIERTGGKWIIEAGELAGMRAADTEKLKAFLSRTADVARMAYARQASTVRRQFVIFGTTNQDHYLMDSTGNRRFWPIRVADTHPVDVDAIERDRDQLWAEAVLLAKDPSFSIRLDPRFYQLEAKVQEGRRVEDPTYDILRAHLENYPDARIHTTALWGLLNLSPDKLTQFRFQKIGDAMRRLGWEKAPSRLSIGGVQHYAYRVGKGTIGLRLHKGIDGEPKLKEVKS